MEASRRATLTDPTRRTPASTTRQELIRYARYHNGGPNRAFVCANVKDFTPDRKFDVILMVGVLHHMADPAGVLVQLGQFLAPGGAIVVNEPQRGNPAISALRWLRKRVDRSYSPDQVEFSEGDLRRLFQQCGYGVQTFAQGVLSTPFAETRPFSEAISLTISRFGVRVDPTLERGLNLIRARRLAWNVIVLAKARAARR